MPGHYIPVWCWPHLFQCFVPPFRLLALLLLLSSCLQPGSLPDLIVLSLNNDLMRRVPRANLSELVHLLVYRLIDVMTRISVAVLRTAWEEVLPLRQAEDY